VWDIVWILFGCSGVEVAGFQRICHQKDVLPRRRHFPAHW